MRDDAYFFAEAANCPMPMLDDAELEARALRLCRDLLDSDASTRAEALQPLESALRARVQALLGHVDDADLQAQGDALIDGQRVGPYVLRAKIGEGGMGEVFLAERADGSFDRQVAIKRIWSGHAPLAARFLRERQLLATLQHPHIAQLLDGGLDAQQLPWLAMELVRGQDIVHWCDSRNASLAQRVDLLVAVCEAVDYAHRNLVVHRDIKPSNVLVDEAGQAKLLDFGIARLLDDSGEACTQTFAMTPAWAAPEQRSGGRVTTASDIYQLGLLARLLLAGLSRGNSGGHMSADMAKRDSEDATHAEVLAQHRGLLPAALRQQLRGDLDSIVATATMPEPEDRYASAGTMAEDFKRWRRGQPVQARAHERGYRLRRALKRWWPALAAGVAALGFLGYHTHRLQQALDQAQRERQRAHLAEQQAQAAATRAQQERRTAGAVSDYFIKMFSMLGPAAIQGDKPASVQQLLEVGAHGLDDVQANRERTPQALAAMWAAMSTVHVNLGEHARALTLADKALIAAKPSEDRRAIAEAYRARANALQWLGRGDEAFLATQQAIATLGQDHGQYGTLPAKLHDDLSWGYKERGDYPKALQHAKLSIESLRSDAQSVRRLGFVQALNNGGDTAMSAGDLQQARQWLEEGARRYPQLANPNPSTWVLLEANRAHLDLHEDRVQDALTRLQALLPETIETFGAAHPRTSLVQDYLLKARLAGRDRAASIATARTLLETDTATYGEAHPAVADARGLLLIALLQGGEEAEALRLRTSLAARCTQDFTDAQAQLVRLACLRMAGDAKAYAASLRKLDALSDVTPWQQRIARGWQAELVRHRSGKSAAS